MLNRLVPWFRSAAAPGHHRGDRAAPMVPGTSAAPGGEPRPGPPLFRSRAATALDLGLLIAMAVPWTANYLQSDSFLGELPGASRAYHLATYATPDLLPVALGLGLLAIGSLLFRRRWPMLMFGSASALVLIIHWRFHLMADQQVTTYVLLTIAAFWAGIASTRFAPFAVTALLVTFAATVPSYLITPYSSAWIATDLAVLSVNVQALVMTGVGLTAAALVRRFDTMAMELRASNEELQTQRSAVARAAVLDERVRIARELHDVVAHHVTTMTVHAGAARQVVTANPQAASDALHNIEQAGRNAVHELHRLLGFLREGDASRRADQGRSPAPSLRHLQHLVGSFRGHLDCEVVVEGPLDTVPASVDLSAYRIVQEALTNVVKHSGSPSASVTITAGADAVEVRVIDEGPGPVATAWPAGRSRRSDDVDRITAGALGGSGDSPALQLADGPEVAAVGALRGSGGDEGSAATGTGHGLLGMRERAALHGGRVASGPSAEGGWTVTALLPYRGRPA